MESMDQNLGKIVTLKGKDGLQFVVTIILSASIDQVTFMNGYTV